MDSYWKEAITAVGKGKGSRGIPDPVLTITFPSPPQCWGLVLPLQDGGEAEGTEDPIPCGPLTLPFLAGQIQASQLLLASFIRIPATPAPHCHVPSATG